MVTDLQTHGQLTVEDRRFAQSETVRMYPFYWRKQHWPGKCTRENFASMEDTGPQRKKKDLPRLEVNILAHIKG